MFSNVVIRRKKRRDKFSGEKELQCVQKPDKIQTLSAILPYRKLKHDTKKTDIQAPMKNSLLTFSRSFFLLLWLLLFVAACNNGNYYTAKTHNKSFKARKKLVKSQFDRGLKGRD
jgi:hypothetical protein